MTAIDALGYLPQQGPTEPLTSREVADLVNHVHDTAIPPDATVPYRFNGLNVITFEAIHYGLAVQITDALNMYKLRRTDVRILRWELPTDVNGKPAVLRVEFCDTTTRPPLEAYFGKTEEVAS